MSIKRRNFLGGLAAAIMLPMVKLIPEVAEATEAKPNKNEDIFPAEILKYPDSPSSEELTSMMKDTIKHNQEANIGLWDIKEGKDFDFFDLYMSKEACEDIRNWGVDQIDEETKKALYGDDFSGIRGLQGNKILADEYATLDSETAKAVAEGFAPIWHTPPQNYTFSISENVWTTEESGTLPSWDTSTYNTSVVIDNSFPACS